MNFTERKMATSPQDSVKCVSSSSEEKMIPYLVRFRIDQFMGRKDTVIPLNPYGRQWRAFVLS
jgi:hypothetical protein